MLKLKPGVAVGHIAPEVVLALGPATDIYDEHGLDLVVTSVCDGAHSMTSLHYIGHAVDLRTRGIPAASVTAIVQKLGDALGAEYDVVLEPDHIHLEWQPKRV